MSTRQRQSEVGGMLRRVPRRMLRGRSPITEPPLGDSIEFEAGIAPDFRHWPSPPSEVIHSLTPKLLRRRLMMADFLAVIFGIGVAFFIQSVVVPVGQIGMAEQWLLVLASLPCWLVGAHVNHLYVARSNSSWSEKFRNIVFTSLYGVACIVGLAFVFHDETLDRTWILVLFIAVVVSLTIERRIADYIFARLRRLGRLSRRVLVVGTDQNATDLVSRLQRNQALGYVPVGYVGTREPVERHGIRTLGGLDRIEDAARAARASGVMISLRSIDGATVNRLCRRLTEVGLHVTLCPGLVDVDLQRLRLQQLDGQSLLYIEPTIRTGWRHTAKRTFDLLGAAAGLLLTAPILLAAAIAIRVDSPGPILYRQRRVGKDGHAFEMLKLRTMHVGADRMKAGLEHSNESDGPLFKIRTDPRVTRVGRLLRKSSIDELPQFWNVLRGDMSIVGPRPALPAEMEQWDAELHGRLRVLPGITGMWQVSGRADTTFEQYKRLDLYYVDNWSLKHDVQIIAKTIYTVLSGHGAS